MDETNNSNGVADALHAGKQLGDITGKISEIAGIPFALVPDGMSIDSLVSVLESADARAHCPRRRKGTATHHELASFIAHVVRFKDEDSAVFADVKSTKLVAVLDYHRATADGSPRWGEHRSVYVCPLSRQWQRWLAQNEKVMSQDAFGDFIDQNLSDLASASCGGPVSTDVAEPAAVLEMARNLVVLTKGEFRREIDRTTGRSTLVCKTDHDSQSTKIPRAFLLGIPVFEGGESYAVEARVRFELRDGRPSFSFSLYQFEEVLRAAFADVRQSVADGAGVPVFAGTPE